MYIHTSISKLYRKCHMNIGTEKIVKSKMLCFVIVLLLVLVASSLSLVKPVIDYHEVIGIPLAERMKKEETQGFEPNIVGGSVAPIGEYPYLAGLIIDLIDSGNSVCGSSLLTSSRLVTAAHCWTTTNHQAWRFNVVLGSQRLFSGGTRVSTRKVVVHPGYLAHNLVNDVAVVYLPRSVRFTESIRPVALPSGSQVYETFAENWAIAAGFGKTTDYSPTNLRSQISHVDLQIISVQSCQGWFGNLVQSSTLCTSGEGVVGVCSGDSGGPLVVRRNGQDILVGIASFVARGRAGTACQAGSPSGFARVTSFLDFIHQHLQALPMVTDQVT